MSEFGIDAESWLCPARTGRLTHDFYRIEPRPDLVRGTYMCRFCRHSWAVAANPVSEARQVAWQQADVRGLSVEEQLGFSKGFDAGWEAAAEYERQQAAWEDDEQEARA